MKPKILTRGCLTIAVLAIGLATLNPVLAQGRQQGLHTWPDTLEIRTVTGTMLVDTTLAHPLYFLDENGDAAADYHLSFGPWWYEPTGSAMRPEAEETVTIVGALQKATTLPITTIVVFEIDGLTWRVPVEYGLFGWNAEPFWDDRGDTLMVTGTVLVDTAYFYEHYYVDVDGDSIPEYKLGFGPPYYEPTSGATRPENGETVTVFGRLHEMDGIDLLAVYEIDGLEWRPLSVPAPWAGGWIQRGHLDTTRAYCVNNPLSWVDFPAGHMGQGMGNAPWPDSIFVQFWETHPDSLPGPFQERRFIGFYLGVHDSQGGGLMNGQFGGHRGRLHFEKEHRFRFQYYDEDLAARGLTEDELRVAFWDEDGQQWVEMSGLSVDTEANTVSFNGSDLSSYYALVAPNVATAVEESGDELPSAVVLYQNYPNPFNPVTTIPYTLATPGRVVLVVYDLLGREVAVLVDGVQAAGQHQVAFEARGLPSGVYFYQLQGEGQTQARQLILMK